MLLRGADKHVRDKFGETAVEIDNNQSDIMSLQQASATSASLLLAMDLAQAENSAPSWRASASCAERCVLTLRPCAECDCTDCTDLARART